MNHIYYIRIVPGNDGSCCLCLFMKCWGLAAGYQPRPQVVDRGTTASYGGQLRYILISSREPCSWAAGRASGL